MWKDGGVVGRSATAWYLRTQIEKIKTDITRIYEKESKQPLTLHR